MKRVLDLHMRALLSAIATSPMTFMREQKETLMSQGLAALGLVQARAWGGGYIWEATSQGKRIAETLAHAPNAAIDVAPQRYELPEYVPFTKPSTGHWLLPTPKPLVDTAPVAAGSELALSPVVVPEPILVPEPQPLVLDQPISSPIVQPTPKPLDPRRVFTYRTDAYFPKIPRGGRKQYHKSRKLWGTNIQSTPNYGLGYQQLSKLRDATIKAMPKPHNLISVKVGKNYLEL